MVFIHLSRYSQVNAFSLLHFAFTCGLDAQYNNYEALWCTFALNFHTFPFHSFHDFHDLRGHNASIRSVDCELFVGIV